MAEAVSVKNTDGNFICSVCQNRNKEMVLSSCFHTFCTDCLQIQVSKMGKERTYLCPLCKATVTLPASFVRNYKEHFDKWDNGANAFKVNVFCDICLDRKIAVSRCLQCEESLCEACTNAHLRMKSSRYHGQRVVPINGHKLDKYSDFLEDTRYCPRHRNEEIIVVCKQCKVLLCLVCKHLEHKNHVTKNITEDAVYIRHKLSKMLQSQMGYSENLQMQLRMMENKKQQYPKELDQELSKVRLQATKLHNAIEQEKNDAEKELVTHYNESTSMSAKVEENLNQDYQDYIKLSREAQSLLDSNNDVYVVRKGESVYEKLSKIESQSSTLSNTDQDKPEKKFVAGKIDKKQMSNLVGHVTLANNSKVVRIWTARSSASNRLYRQAPAGNQRRESVSTVSTHSQFGSHPELLNQIWLPFTDSLGYVYGIAPAGNQQVWVTLLDHKYIILIDQQGIVKKKVEIGTICEDITSDGEGGCFVTCPGNISIKRIYKSGEVRTILDNLIQDPHGIASLIHYDRHDCRMRQELYVCFTEPKGLESTVTNPSQHGCIRSLSFSGSDLGISFPVRSPVRVAVAPDTMMLAIVDHSNGCVMVTDKSGQFVQALYCGRDNFMFRPLGVCFDGNGCVLFADWQSGKVCHMTPDGSLVNDLITGLDGPQSLAITNGDTLWIGTKLGKIYVYRI